MGMVLQRDMLGITVVTERRLAMVGVVTNLVITHATVSVRVVTCTTPRWAITVVTASRPVMLLNLIAA